MARRPRQEEERSMDSLMDAMTNVVGILLLILIVSSLGMTAAVEKAMENMPEISQEQLEEMRSSRKKTLDNLQDLRSTQNNVKETAIKPEEADQLALALDSFEKENADLASKTSDVDELLTKSKELEPVKLEKEIRNTKATRELNDLEAALAAKPLVESPPAQEITLPDPRPADPEAFVYYVACRKRKVYVIGEPYEVMSKIRTALDAQFTELAYQGNEIGYYTHNLLTTRSDPEKRPLPFMVDYQAKTKRAKEALGYMNSVSLKSPQLPAGRPIFQELFGANEASQEEKKEWSVAKFRLDKNKVKNFFEKNAGKGELTFFPSFPGDRVKIDIGLSPDRGIPENQLLSINSPFMELIDKAALNRRAIVMYYVSSDSFDTYLKARDYSTSKNVAAGWTLWDEERITNLQPNKLMESLPYDMSQLPASDYLKLSQFVGPKLAGAVNAKIDSFTADLESIPVPKELTDPKAIADFKTGLKENREQWAREIPNMVKLLYRTPLAVSEAKKGDVLIQEHPPEVMFIRTFVPSNPPTAPRPAQGAPQGGGGRPNLILD